MASVYIEVGKKCYSMCVTCDVNNKERPERLIDKEGLLYIIDALCSMGYDEFRFTGYEPISCTFLADVLEERPQITSKILTTLLRYDRCMEVCTYPMVSLSGVEEYYKEYFTVDHFDRFKENFEMLTSVRKDVEINTTLSPALRTRDSMQKLVQFLNCYSDAITNVQVFSAMEYGGHEYMVDETMAREELNNLTIPWTLEYDSSGVVQHKCNVSRETLYVKHNGDVYPCCMTGGEIGQDLIEETRLVNMFSFKNLGMIEALLKSPLENLNNKICNHCTPKYAKINQRMFN